MRILSNKKPQPCKQATKVVAGGGEQGADGVAAGVGKVIAADAVVVLEVADHGFDGAGKLLVVLRQVRPVAAPGVLGPFGCAVPASPAHRAQPATGSARAKVP